MIRFHTDHYFHIGSSHHLSGKTCQDYALSRSNENLACAIVSDGCSTGRHTDVGSRVLTFSTLQAIKDHAKASVGSLDTAVLSIISRQQQIISTTRFLLGLVPDDMLATCVYAYLNKNGGVVHVQGDGVVAFKYKDSNTEMHRFDWAKNAPFYPSYNEADAEKYIRNLHEGVVDTAILTHTSIRKSSSGKTESEELSTIPFDAGRNGYVFTLNQEQLAKVEFIVIFSDGVTQIGKLGDGGDWMLWHEAVSNLLNFKMPVGEFAKRRMIRELRDLAKVGKGPIDDISYAVIRLEDVKE